MLEYVCLLKTIAEQNQLEIECTNIFELNSHLLNFSRKLKQKERERNRREREIRNP